MPQGGKPLEGPEEPGDHLLEAQFFTAVTGITKTEADLDKDAERVVTLLRALTVRSMGTADMRNAHDAMNKWIYTPDKKDGKEIPQFTKGTIQMEKSDLDLGLGMVYKQFGWDEKTGAPTKATLEALGLQDVAAELGAKGLLPA